MCIANKALYKYINPVFVETGTYFGEGVSAALEAKFEEIHSIEISPSIHATVCKTFETHDNVHIVCGDSTEVLWDVIKDIQDKITFLLDAHSLSWADDTNEQENLVEFPLVQELKIIAKHPRKDHTIIVDDVRLFESTFETSMREVMDLLYDINPEYSFVFEDGIIEHGRIGKNEILIAQVRS